MDINEITEKTSEMKILLGFKAYVRGYARLFKTKGAYVNVKLVGSFFEQPRGKSVVSSSGEHAYLFESTAADQFPVKIDIV